MKRSILLLSALLLCVETFAAKEYKLLSPNGKLEVTITAEPQLAYSVKCDGEEILTPSKIGLKIYEGKQLGKDDKVKRAKRTTVNAEIPTQFYFRNIVSLYFINAKTNHQIGNHFTFQFRFPNDCNCLVNIKQYAFKTFQ